MKKYRLAIFASGSGSNAEAICRYFQQHPFIEVALIVTNNPQAGVLAKAKDLSIESIVITKEQFRASETTLNILAEKRITHIALAGFLLLIPPYLINAFPSKIINIHPALLPKFGGKGMYGMKVHEAVLASGEPETGITIHLVNEHFDEGHHVFQNSCEVLATDQAVDIAKKVLALEHLHYPKVIEQWIIKGY
jgi:phosphoribosylglycinamide formyltransferase 1